MNFKREDDNEAENLVQGSVSRTISPANIKPTDILFESPGRLDESNQNNSKTKTFVKMLKRNQAFYQVCTDIEKYNLAQSVVQVFHNEFSARFLLQTDYNVWSVMPKAMAIVQTLSIMQEKLRQGPTSIPHYEGECDAKEVPVIQETLDTTASSAAIKTPGKLKGTGGTSIENASSANLLASSKVASLQDERENSASIDLLIRQSLEEYHKRQNLSQFPLALHHLISEIEIAAKLTPDTELVAQFVSGGDAFMILNPQKFETDYLRIIGINSIDTFHEELDRYGFRRIEEGKDKGGYVHALFRRQYPLLAEQIKSATSRQTRQLPHVEDTKES
mmetsp:Transcript_8332/g.12832  ORF Transcript_8332/g.12832 Transcript_8332/m.12832 type:complete len:333 (-) Transcript_8332:82-1080(-)|eukprot:CAMPEP_0178906784 /NCGR_PEP_ID=MMETSP0786-20121207/7011_1 /TAXON_ID=186022 /ORGANISM="Thalassionema frauenfeldii, Strain CCMP 1798" /LENGTH=332 /DNA_ID=CAMNT_0020578517 /DNA_START=112 /DNA_END=1110 /DNA_ORIENTATION=+